MRKRSIISRAARLVKVTARIVHGGTPRTPTGEAMRWVMTRVFPEPGPARTSSGAPCAITALRWAGFNRSRICSAVVMPRIISGAEPAAGRLHLYYNGEKKEARMGPESIVLLVVL